MYTFKKAVVLGRSSGAQWLEVDISRSLVVDIYRRYVEIFVALTYDGATADVIVDFGKLRSTYDEFTGTLGALIAALGNTTLPLVSSLPDTTVKYVRYRDARQVLYKLSYADHTRASSVGVPEAQLPDLEITKDIENVDISKLHTHCLLTVAGFVHGSYSDGTRTWIKGGGTTARKNLDHATCGILNFSDIGSLTRYSFTDDRIFGLVDDTDLKSRIYLKLPTYANTTNKSPILVLGGYLVLPAEGVFWEVSSGIYALDMRRLPYFERLMESIGRMDLSSLPLDESTTSPGTYSTESCWSDATLRAYLKLSQTFLVLVDTPEIAYNYHSIQTNGVAGVFLSYQEPRSPMVAGYGKLIDYWCTPDDGIWCCSTTDGYYKNFLFQYSNFNQLKVINDRLHPEEPYRVASAHLLDIVGYVNPTSI